jgi:hypothetical protein
MSKTDETTFNAKAYVLDLAYGTGKKKKVKRPVTIAEFEEVERIARAQLLETMADNNGALETEVPKLSEIEADESDDSGCCLEVTGFANDLLIDVRTWEKAANVLLEARAETAEKAA